MSSRFTHTLQEESSHPGAHNLSRVDPDWIGDDSGGENVVPEIKLRGYTEEKKTVSWRKQTGSGDVAQLLSACLAH